MLVTHHYTATSPRARPGKRKPSLAKDQAQSTQKRRFKKQKLQFNPEIDLVSPPPLPLPCEDDTAFNYFNNQASSPSQLAQYLTRGGQISDSTMNPVIDNLMVGSGKPTCSHLPAL